MEETLHFPGGATTYYYTASFNDLQAITASGNTIYITDSNLHKLYQNILHDKQVIIIPPGEQSKTLDTINTIIQQLIALEADRKTLLIGVGGGVITDITGFAASIYMRGISFGFLPTTLLGMTDAAIGGKNGVNTGLLKNMVGIIRQPEFIAYDLSFLQTLPIPEWSNGFAEIIKYACIFDSALFLELQQHNISYYRQNTPALQQLIRKCAGWKNKTVMEDEQEQSIRKLLNFGHTAGHALENRYNLPHGQAVALGMIIACNISVQVTGLPLNSINTLKSLLTQYGLPVSFIIDPLDVISLLKMDKKKSGDTIDYIVLEEIGRASIRKISLQTIADNLHIL